MICVGYHNPLVPPEWIAAHGLRPKWLWLEGAAGGVSAPIGRGQCPFAASVAALAAQGAAGEAVIFTTACDQMRYAAALAGQAGASATFLMHLPVTWQTTMARNLYRDELLRLGRFLERQGGRRPTSDALWQTMQRYQAAREGLLARRCQLSARQLTEELAAVRSALSESNALRSPADASGNGKAEGAPATLRPRAAAIALALVGGPLTAAGALLCETIEAAGGRIALDGTEGGERTLPAVFADAWAAHDPLEALTASYFGAIVDVWRRPVAPLHDWLAGEIERRGIRGVIFHRYLSCDLWHGELQPLRKRLRVPVLDLDAVQEDHRIEARSIGRIEAFLETLR